MSNNLSLVEIAEGMSDPETAVNTALQKIGEAITEFITIDVTGGNVSLTELECQENQVIKVIASATLRTITVPQMKRVLVFYNTSANPVSIVLGTTTLTLDANASDICYLDGTANGLYGLTAGGGGGGGISDAPADGSTYGRKDNTWTNVASGGGGISDAPADGSTYARKDNAWIGITSGGGGGGSWDFNPPSASDFDNTIYHGSARLLLLTDDTDAGLLCDAGVLNGDGNNRGALKPVNGSADFDIIAKCVAWMPDYNYLSYGLALYRASGSYSVFFGFGTTNTGNSVLVQKWNTAGSSFSSNELSILSENARWFRIRFTQSTGVVRFFVSMDGKNWSQVHTDTASNLLGGAPTHCGPCMNTNNGSYGNLNFKMSVPYYSG